MFSTSCAIFWMYNDSWPVTHGWTIVDYYLRKKLAYHPVRRAFQPVTVVVADEDPLITIYGVNDSPSDWRGTLQYGLFSVDGHYPLRESRQVHLPSNGALKLFSFAKKAFVDAGIKTHGAFAVLKERDTVYAQHRIFLATFKELELKKPDVNIKYVDDRAIFTSPVFVWRACVDLDGEADVSDNCFDLLPNIPYSVKAINGEKITLKRSGNDFIK
jgi:beta-mannosidase